MVKLKYKIIPVLFIVFLVIPFINNYIPIIKVNKLNEKRVLSEKPEFDISHLDPFPKKYEKYYNDHFKMKGYFVERYNYLQWKFAGISPKPGTVVAGKNEYLYYNNESIQLAVGKYKFQNRKS